MIKVTKIKRINPTDKNFLSKILVDKIVFNNNYEYDVYFGSKFIAYVIIKFNSNSIYKIEILDPQYRRRGLATYIYDYIEKDLNIKLIPSKDQLPDGKEFWKSRLKRKNPYRKDQIDDDAKIEKLNYRKGYLIGLVKGLRDLDKSSLWPLASEIVNSYFWKGYRVGLDDSVEQLKLIPKNKLKSYIKELEEEIDAL